MINQSRKFLVEKVSNDIKGLKYIYKQLLVIICLISNFQDVTQCVVWYPGVL